MTKPPLLMIPRRHVCGWRGCPKTYFSFCGLPSFACPDCQQTPEFKVWAQERKRASRRASYKRCAGRAGREAARIPPVPTPASPGARHGLLAGHVTGPAGREARKATRQS